MVKRIWPGGSRGEYNVYTPLLNLDEDNRNSHPATMRNSLAKNSLTSITGTATDNQKLGSVQIQVKKGEDYWSPVSGYSGTENVS